MRPVLCIDFGSTYTKLTAVDLERPKIIGRAQAFTTASSDISIGLDKAMWQLEKRIGTHYYQAKLACSSAAGGLNMVACGLVPGLTSKAARLAAFGAGAKVIKTYAYQLTKEDIEEIDRINPDILLLTGGIDGGNSEVILQNAASLSKTRGSYPIVIAGNRVAQQGCVDLLKNTQHPVYRAENVMPEMNRLNIEPVQDVLREVFLNRIILAKGLTKTNALLDGILMPTPSAVMDALSLLSKGTKKSKGLGELLAVDLGGATTDVYSMAKGDPTNPNTVIRGLPEPFAKRTVEGDIGMRYNARGILEAAGAEQISKVSSLSEQTIQQMVLQLHQNPSALPETGEELLLDKALAAGAVGVALNRHAGVMERVYTPVGPVDQQTGKDLTQVNRMVVTGGALIFSETLQEIIANALSMQDVTTLTPRTCAVTSDRQYVLSAMGLLAGYDQEAALQLLMERFGKEEAYAIV